MLIHLHWTHGQQPYNSFMNDVYLTYVLSRQGTSQPFALRNTGHHFSTTFGAICNNKITNKKYTHRKTENVAWNRLWQHMCLWYENRNKKAEPPSSNSGVHQATQIFCHSVHVCKWPRAHFVSSGFGGYKYIFMCRWIHKYGICK